MSTNTEELCREWFIKAQDAEEAFEAAKKIRDFVLKKTDG